MFILASSNEKMSPESQAQLKAYNKLVESLYKDIKSLNTRFTPKLLTRQEFGMEGIKFKEYRDWNVGTPSCSIISAVGLFAPSDHELNILFSTGEIKTDEDLEDTMAMLQEIAKIKKVFNKYKNKLDNKYDKWFSIQFPDARK